MATSMTLSQLMSATRQRADMFPVGYTPSLTNTDYFVTDPELISYINQSYFELYDLLVTTYEDYYVADPLIIPTDGTTNLYPLPDGVLYSAAKEFYKVLGVDLGLNNSGNAFVTLKKFDFIGRNRYLYPQLTSTYLGVFNLRYRVVGNNLMLIPTPSAGQYIRMWYIPRMQTLTALADVADGVSGWTEYIITDAAIKCAQKEETDVTVLAMQKAALIKRIEETAMNRDAGQPDTISNVRSQLERWGGDFGTGNTPMGGY
ncbi:MAG: hypothetical protein IPL34_20210 [Thiofilum sp.]|uniref:phage adaptor protein n=1 Tax=Thiofilum sp. TaxID=2212733 RepID=UPI0025E8896A|nr:hypothetical protein [Thiofilum sp.]MBK8455606.1 hypothetical protein [Thiofilum sp.]